MKKVTDPFDSNGNGSGRLLRREVVRQSGRTLCQLRLDARERALGLSLDRARRLAIEVKQVVGKAETGLHGKFAHGDAVAGGEVEVDQNRARYLIACVVSREDLALLSQ